MDDSQGAKLSGLTTLRLGGPAGRLVEASDDQDVVATVSARDAAFEPVLVLGDGSNVVVGDAGFPGTVVLVRTRGRSVRIDAADGCVDVTVASGESWDELVAVAVSEGWAGIEALAGIPGRCGAVPIQNVGAYGQEVASTIVTVRAYDRATRHQLTLAVPECGFGYRTSRFKRETDRFLVLDVTFRLRKGGLSAPVTYAELASRIGVDIGARAPMHEVREAVLELRRAKGMVLDELDHDTWSAGSFFTNPVLSPAAAALLPPQAPRWRQPDGGVKTSAAWLIEQAGYGKGYGSGPAQVSGKHTLALSNRGGATTAQLLALAREIRHGVRERFGVELVNEPVIVGAEL